MHIHTATREGSLTGRSQICLPPTPSNISWLTNLQLVGRLFIIRQVPSFPLALEEPGTPTHFRHRLFPVDGSSLATMHVNIITTTISGNENLDTEIDSILQ